MKYYVFSKLEIQQVYEFRYANVEHIIKSIKKKYTINWDHKAA